MIFYILTSKSPKEKVWESRCLDAGDGIGRQLVMGLGSVSLGAVLNSGIPSTADVLKLPDRLMYCDNGLLYQSFDRKTFHLIGSGIRDGIKAFSRLARNYFSLLLFSGVVVFGKIIDGFFYHRPCNYADQVNSYAPLAHVRFSDSLMDHCCSIVTRKGAVVFLTGTSDCEKWEGDVTFPNLPFRAIFASRIDGLFTIVVAKSWTVSLHRDLSIATKQRYYQWLLSSRRKGLHFILFLQVAELI
jgi:hypothetical protein